MKKISQLIKSSPHIYITRHSMVKSQVNEEEKSESILFSPKRWDRGAFDLCCHNLETS